MAKAIAWTVVTSIALLAGCGGNGTVADAGSDAGAGAEASSDGAVDAGAESRTDASDASDAGAACMMEVDAAPPADGGTVRGLRGGRYCEILLATLASGQITADVYNTQGLGDCPQAAWDALDPTAIAAEYHVTAARLNGPRYWTLDGFDDSSLLDPTVQWFGCIPMRLAGRVQAQSASSAAMPYTPHTIMRNTVSVFLAGGTVYELVDPGGQVYDMQSYSTQTTPQTVDSLATLGARLTLPTGWSYRTRVLDADLHVTAVGGFATVVQDDFANTYQLSQQ